MQADLEAFCRFWRRWVGTPVWVWQTEPPAGLPPALSGAMAGPGEHRVSLGEETWWLFRSDQEAPLSLACQVRGEGDLHLARLAFHLLSSLAAERAVNQQLTDELILAWDRLDFVFGLAQIAGRFAELGPQLNHIAQMVLRAFPAEEAFLLLWQGDEVRAFSSQNPPHPLVGQIPRLTLPAQGLQMFDRRQVAQLPEALRQSTATWRNLVLTPIAVTGFQGMLGLRDFANPTLSAADRSLLLSVAEQVAALVEASLAREAHLRDQHLRRELNIARQIQLSMLPRALPTLPDLELAALIQPAFTVGGDFYDLVVTPERILLLVGDVAGKGVPAAMLTALMHVTFKSEARSGASVAQILQAMHRQVYPDLDRAEMFITVALLAIERADRRFAYAGAGHTNSLWLRAADAQVVDLPSTGLPFGVLPGAEYDLVEGQLAPGDEVLLYTDGVTEVENPQGAVMGKQGLIDVLLAVHPAAGEAQLSVIRQAVEIHRSTEILHDDLAMALVRVPAPQPDLLHLEPFVYPIEVRSARAITRFVRQQAERMRFPSPQQRQSFLDELELAVSEIATNIVTHAFPPGRTGRVQGRVAVYPTRVVVDLIDNGEPYEPATVPVRRAVDEPPTRGYGMHIARQLLQVCAYTRMAGQRNHWHLEKRFP